MATPKEPYPAIEILVPAKAGRLKTVRKSFKTYSEAHSAYKKADYQKRESK